jgi:hypothetical protein
MDKLNNHRAIIKSILQKFLDQQQKAKRHDDNVETLLITDDEHGHYLVMKNGWQGKERVQHIPIFIRLHEGKVWVEEDWTDYEVVDRLLEAGIPQSDIVLAFHHPALRPYADFATS